VWAWPEHEACDQFNHGAGLPCTSSLLLLDAREEEKLTLFSIRPRRSPTRRNGLSCTSQRRGRRYDLSALSHLVPQRCSRPFLSSSHRLSLALHCRRRPYGRSLDLEGVPKPGTQRVVVPLLRLARKPCSFAAPSLVDLATDPFSLRSTLPVPSTVSPTTPPSATSGRRIRASLNTVLSTNGSTRSSRNDWSFSVIRL
jgi:hypothetical protein